MQLYGVIPLNSTSTFSCHVITKTSFCLLKTLLLRPSFLQLLGCSSHVPSVPMSYSIACRLAGRPKNHTTIWTSTGWRRQIGSPLNWNIPPHPMVHYVCVLVNILTLLDRTGQGDSLTRKSIGITDLLNYLIFIRWMRANLSGIIESQTSIEYK